LILEKWSSNKRSRGLAENADKSSIRPSRIGWVAENQPAMRLTRAFRTSMRKTR
jgi:hypothetical protein